MGLQQKMIGSATPLAAAVSPSSLYKLGSTATITTDSPGICSPSGGSGSYTYSWVKVSGDTISAVSPSSASTLFTASGMGPNSTRTAIFRCDVNDGLTTVQSNTITVTLERDTA